MSDVQRLPSILRFYQRFLRNRDSAQFVYDVMASYSLATVERLLGSSIPEIRRASILAIGHIGDFESNKIIGRALRDRDRGVRLIAERYCRQLWSSAGSVANRQSLSVADRLETVGRFKEALQIAQRVVAAQPSFAEAWRHTGICYYGLGDNRRAIQHLRRALGLNPFQFEAAISLAQCYLDVDKPLIAYRWLRRASRINPGLEHVRLEASRLLRGTRKE